MSAPSQEFPVERPLFVMGTGRCGLTPLMHLVAYHPGFAWPSQYQTRFPQRYSLAFLSRLVNHPPFRGRAKFWRYVPAHAEAYPFWNSLFYGFSRPFRDLVADDASPYIRLRVRRALSEIMRYQGKKQFIAEYSGWSRIDFLKAIFPDAQFIHVVRDGRAVANSLTHVSWWDGWQGIYKSRLGVPPAEDLRKLEKYGYSFLALAGLHWRILIRNIMEKTGKLSKSDLLVVRYEDLVKEPQVTARKCIAFAGLDPDDNRFRRHLKLVQIIDANSKRFRIPSWRENMSPAQVAMLEDLLAEELAAFGYLQSSNTVGRAVKV